MIPFPGLFLVHVVLVCLMAPVQHSRTHNASDTHSKTKVNTCTLFWGLAAISQSSAVWCLSSHDHLYDGFSICVVIVTMYIWLLLLVIMNLFKKKQKQEHVLSMDLLYTHIAVRCGNTVIVVIISKCCWAALDLRWNVTKIKKIQYTGAGLGSFHFQFTAFNKPEMWKIEK